MGIASMPRLLSLDAFRGFVILAMIWVNYIAEMPGIAPWLKHAGPKADGITVPDLVFPAFLFMVGMAVPLSLRRHLGRTDARLLARLLWRAASLMLAGVVLANAYRYDAASALLPRSAYLLLFYGAMVLLWGQFGARRWPAWLGGVLMLLLLAAFRGSLVDEFDSTWLQHSWWGILGMIGWAYLVCSLAYLATGGHGAAMTGVLGALLALYLGGTAGALDWLPAALRGVVNIPQVLGSTSANVVAGALAGMLLVARPADATVMATAALHRKRLRQWGLLAAALLATGLLLRPFHGINKIEATASYTLVCAAIVLALFMLFYWLIEVCGWQRWAALLLPAGANALLAYILPDLWEQAAAVLQLPRLWWPYLASGGGAGLFNAAAMSLLMLGLVAGANRAGLRLKF
jgi:heparan-alpha-glucosaminide N-acetyltransferase